MKAPQAELWPDGDDLPLFSGTCQRVPESPFRPQEATRQERLPGIGERPAL